MQPVEFFNWMVPPDPEQIDGNWRRSRWKMSREYAHQHYPGATCIESTRQVINCPESEAERYALGFAWVNSGAPGMKK